MKKVHIKAEAEKYVKRKLGVASTDRFLSIKDAYVAGASAERKRATELCQADARIHRENDESTWAALSDSLAHKICTGEIAQPVECERGHPREGTCSDCSQSAEEGRAAHEAANLLLNTLAELPDTSDKLTAIEAAFDAVKRATRDKALR